MTTISPVAAPSARPGRSPCPCARAPHQPHATSRVLPDDVVGAVVGGVGGHEDLEPVGGVVELEAVLELAPDLVGLVAGGDDDRDRRQSRPLPGITRATARQHPQHERIATYV